MTDREIFQRNLSDLMRITKVKQIDIAKYAEVSYQTVSAWVTGRGYPRADAMEKLCQFFGIRQSALTEQKDKKTDEDQLLEAFRMMSDEGKYKLLERADELVLLCPKGKKRYGKTKKDR